ncbi:MFS transporter [Gilvimarinus sp. F26214L]|uniref:MFS transporter n=1 Tax=Gilvimarinus sp. DZF01 TaxID=3461371 RepID=UPI004046233C
MNDPRDILAKSPMTTLQVVVVAITIGLNALDGFDVLSISFAAPGIAAEWGIDRGALGIVLSMELVGMCVGSLVLGGTADKYGRRSTILGCLVIMTIGMFMVTTVQGIVGLSLWRVITGLGIGGMLAAINPMAAEFSNDRRRHMNVSLMVIGYPIGGIVGGSVVAPLLMENDWRSVFYFGSAVTALFIPLVYFLVPESVHWLARKQPEGALERINATFKRLGHRTIAALPAITEETRKRSIGDIFGAGLLATTLIVTFAYLFHITTFYFILKWVPKIVADMGFAASSAAGVLTWANVGGAAGGALFGLLTLRVGLKPLTIGILLISVATVSLFGRTPADLAILSLLAAVAGFCTNAGVVGLYAIFVQAFPTHVRAFGTGFAIGIGRGGAVVSPIIAGFLFDAGNTLGTVAIVMALGSLFAAGALLFLKLKPEAERSAEPEKKPQIA